MKKGMTLGDMALAAMKDAARRVAEEHRRAGLPLVTWKDGKVVHQFVKEAEPVCDKPTGSVRGRR